MRLLVGNRTPSAIRKSTATSLGKGQGNLMPQKRQSPEAVLVGQVRAVGAQSNMQITIAAYHADRSSSMC
jgi:hypothetical protein